VSASLVVRRTQPALENTCTSVPCPNSTTPVAPVSKKHTTRPAWLSVRARPPSRARTASIVDRGRVPEGPFTGSDTRRDTKPTLALTWRGKAKPRARGPRCFHSKGPSSTRKTRKPRPRASSRDARDGQHQPNIAAGRGKRRRFSIFRNQRMGSSFSRVQCTLVRAVPTPVRVSRASFQRCCRFGFRAGNQ
jgi:hypothetical protein